MIEITKIKYFNESGTIDVTEPRNPKMPLPALRDKISFGSPRRWMVTNTEQRKDTLWVWLGTP